MNKKFLYFIVGLGSIGKRHAVHFSNLLGELVLIDPDPYVHSWASENIKKNFKYYKSINLINADFNLSDFFSIAVISNWGNQHYSSLIDLKNLGVKTFSLKNLL